MLIALIRATAGQATTDKFSLMIFWLLMMTMSSPVFPDDKFTFDDHAKPIFQKRCASCHNDQRKSGGLDLSNYTNMMQGGSSGTSIEPGDAEGSYLYQLVTHDESPEMPPSSDKIPDSEINLLAAWINGGALENSGSVAKQKKKIIVASGSSVGVRPTTVAYPLRLPLQPYFQSSQPGTIMSVATSPWSPIVALASAKQILLYDTAKSEFLGALPFPEGRANDLKFSRSGALLVAGGGRHGLVGQAFAWDVESTERVFEIGEELDNVLAVDISPDHSLVTLGGPQKILRVYSTQSEELVYEVKKHTDWITATGFSPDGVLLASADRAGGLQLWEAETGNEYLTLAGHNNRITGLSWRLDGNVLASAGDDGTIRVWEMENGRQLKSWNAHAAGAASVEFTRDGQIVSTGRDKLAKLWQQDGKLVRQFKGLGEIGISTTWCDESKRVIASDLDGHVLIWNGTDGVKLGSLDANPSKMTDRLREAEQNVVAVDSRLQPMRKKLAQIQVVLKNFQSEMNDQTQARIRFSGELNEIKTSIAAAKSETEEIVMNRKQWRAELDEKENVLPMVDAARENAVRASESIPADVHLREIANSLEVKHNDILKTIAGLNQQLAVSRTQDEVATAKIAKLNGQLNEKQSSFASTEKRIGELTTQQAPIKNQQIELVDKIKQLERELQKYRDSVARWTDEVEFAKHLDAKSKERASVQEHLIAMDIVLSEAREKLDQAKAEFDRIQNEKSGLQYNASQIDSDIRELRKRKE